VKDIGQIQILFSDESLVLLNVCLGFIMFGIALGIKPKDFLEIIRNPKAILTGIASQFFLLPFLTFLLVLAFNPHPAIGLGMILVAACPGGNVSNFISSVSGANVALSVGLTAFATALSPIFTPLNFDVWAKAIPATQEYLQTFELSFQEVLKTVLLLLVFPLILGIGGAHYFPAVAKRIEKPIRMLSFLILMGFIGVALAKNFEAFRSYLSIVFLLVLIHNSMAFAIGYFAGKIVKLKERDRRTISIETGIQNSGLGLIIIFTFFGGNGGMALVAAWWGIWHIIAGLVLSRFFARRDKRLIAGSGG
jgi:BASS family bile acid:Na+ symporter